MYGKRDSIGKTWGTLGRECTTHGPGAIFYDVGTEFDIRLHAHFWLLFGLRIQRYCASVHFGPLVLWFYHRKRRAT